MHISPVENLQPLLARIREFINAEVIPIEHDFLHRPFRELLPALNEKRQRVKALGLWAPQLPQEYGGLGLSLTEFAVVSEELWAHAARPLPLQLPSARHGQHGSAVAARDARTARVVSMAAGARRST